MVRKAKRRKHVLKKFAVADVETDPFQRGLLVVPFSTGFYDGKSLQTWWGENCIRDMLEHCRKLDIIVYYHNFGKFDLWQALQQCDPELWGTARPIGGRIASIKYGQCEFRDSYALIPKPLASWEKDKLDYRKMLRHRREVNKQEILEYLKTDLRSLYVMLEEFFKRYGRQLTLASTTIKILEKDFGVKIPRLNQRDDGWFRRFYFAGRVQFWGLGRHVGRYAIYDINSAFPWAMTKKHWISNTWTEGPGWPKTKKEQSLYLVECISGGALPIREKDKSISFPDGKVKAFVTGWELLTGLRLGAIKELNILWHWKPSRLRDFKRYVLKFYRMKQKAKNKADRYFAKIILNALYGKFALNPRNFKEVAIRPWRKLPLDKKGKPDTSWEVSYDDREKGITFYQRPSPVSDDRFYNVCISASITGCVRAFLYEAIQRSKPLYCDTDSLITRRAPQPIGDGLGQWKREMRCDVVWIGGKKLYVAHNQSFPWRKRKFKGAVHVASLGWTSRDSFKCAAKGVRLSVEDLIAVCEGKQRTGHFEAPSYSIFRPTSFTKRRIRRADKRK